ncbi:hypothetical protein GCM10027610_002860 [Dactylosporangium cerinum]
MLWMRHQVRTERAETQPHDLAGGLVSKADQRVERTADKPWQRPMQWYRVGRFDPDILNG